MKIKFIDPSKIELIQDIRPEVIIIERYGDDGIPIRERRGNKSTTTIIKVQINGCTYELKGEDADYVIREHERFTSKKAAGLI